jgi:hypothetical protein
MGSHDDAGDTSKSSSQHRTAESQHGNHGTAERPPQIENRRSLQVQDPQYWRDRAKEARMHADQVQDLEMKALWLRIVEGHERQAGQLERLRDLPDKPLGC